MDFAISKIAWLLGSPDKVLLAIFLVGALLAWTPWWRGGRALVTLAAGVIAILCLVPVGWWSVAFLENRFPANPPLPERVDGIIVLGGMVDPIRGTSRQQPSLNGAVERLTEFVALSRRYPEARLAFTGGSGDLFNQELKEAEAARHVLDAIGVDTGRVVFESQSRTTAENARLSKDLLQPRANETWVLVTSAVHMPRAVGVFRGANWRVIPWPVDYQTPPDLGWSASFGLIGPVAGATLSLHEFVGLAWYYLSGKSPELIPAAD